MATASMAHLMKSVRCFILRFFYVCPLRLMEFSFSPIAARNSVFEIDLYVQLMLIVQTILRERDVSGLTDRTNQVTD